MAKLDAANKGMTLAIETAKTDFAKTVRPLQDAHTAALTAHRAAQKALLDAQAAMDDYIANPTPPTPLNPPARQRKPRLPFIHRRRLCPRRRPQRQRR